MLGMLTILLLGERVQKICDKNMEKKNFFIF